MAAALLEEDQTRAAMGLRHLPREVAAWTSLLRRGAFSGSAVAVGPPAAARAWEVEAAGSGSPNGAARRGCAREGKGVCVALARWEREARRAQPAGRGRCAALNKLLNYIMSIMFM